jgi:hypothetical protein
MFQRAGMAKDEGRVAFERALDGGQRGAVAAEQTSIACSNCWSEMESPVDVGSPSESGRVVMAIGRARIGVPDIACAPGARP